ncbi:ImmA/IrrE family metallo-endopeptidase [Streptomyces sp. NPDC059783]|uniref:ImmA/IrrE family metallo-endopeptidase n=1 Tax=Streptomyces sp. NPDC059783 TaxID=3346944 RepID=UPI0036466AE0
MLPTRRSENAGWPVSYEPVDVCVELNVRVTRLPLVDTQAAWLPQHRTIALDAGLSPIEERCALAHQVEHVLAGHTIGCGIGTYAERPLVRASFSQGTLRQERHAEHAAARRLVDADALGAIFPWTDLSAAAAELKVTEPILRTRIAGLNGKEWQWLQAKSKIAG